MTSEGSPTRVARVLRSHRVFFILLLVHIALSLATIDKFPRVWIDTAWTCMAPYELITHGHLANPMRPISGLDEHLLAPYVVQRIMLAGVYTVFGFGLLQSRLLSVLIGVLLLVSVYIFTEKHFEKRVAVLAVLLLMIDNVYFLTSRSVRADIFVSLFSVAAFFLFLSSYEKNNTRYMIPAGFLIGISLYTHPNTVLVLAAILFIFLQKEHFSLFRSRFFWYFSISCLAGFFPYAGYVISQDFSHGFRHFLGQVGLGVEESHRNLITNLLGESERYAAYILFPRRIVVFLVQVMAVFFGARSKSWINRQLALQVLIFVLLLPFWNPTNSTSRYFIVILPAVSILTSELFFRAWDAANAARDAGQRLGGYLRLATAAILVAYAANQMAGDAYAVWSNRNHDYARFIRQIREVIPRNSRIWGSASFWIGLYDHPYMSQLTPTEKVVEFRPEYVILYDSTTWGNRSATTGVTVQLNKWFRERGEFMEKLCRDRGEFLKRIPNEYYGNIEIYRIRDEGLPPNPK
jgi:4-amino-4-deoxy-L-arabinose transferase-like glycosyltransferase